MQHKVGKKLIIVIDIIGIILMVSFLIINYRKEQESAEQFYAMGQEEIAKTKKLEEESQITLISDEKLNLNDGMDAQTIISTNDLINSAQYTSGYRGNAAVVFQPENVIYEENEDDLYMLVFEGHTEKTAVQIIVGNDNKSSTYYLTSQPSAFYIPIRDMNSFRITMKSDFQNTYISNIEILRISGGKSADYVEQKYGQYNLTDSTIYEPTVAEIVNETSCREVLTNGELVYVLCNTALIVYADNGSDIKRLGSVDGLGNTSHMAFVNKQTIVITSRENDVFFVDVSNFEHPQIISTYDSLDFATGVEACENYVFICSRYFGVEIVDISNISNPKLCSIINTGGECIQSCFSDNYLYISNWNMQAVLIYDISNPNNPRKCQQIDTDGNPYGIEISGNNLFVATGHNSVNEHENKWDSGYGGGHGMEIYDVSDNSNIKWMSTVKIDGRLYYPAVDGWGVYLSGHYAVLASTYGGEYIYDVANVENPIRVGRISIKIPSSSNKYSYIEDERYIFPYNPNLYLEDTVLSIDFEDETIYMAGYTTGLYRIHTDLDVHASNIEQIALMQSDGSYFESFSGIITTNGLAKIYSDSTCVNAIEVSNNHIFLACGDGNVEILDEKHNLLKRVKTSGPAEDILVIGENVYVAEGNFGIEVFQINSSGFLDKISFYQSELPYETVTQLRVSSDGRYLMAQDGWTKIKILDIQNPNELTEVDTLSPGILYFRNLLNTNENSKFFGYESNREIKLYETKNGELNEIATLNNTFYEERNGMCDVEGELLAIYKNGYVIVTSEQLKKNIDLSTLPVISCGDNYKLKGEPSYYKGTLVVTDACAKTVTVLNIKDIKNPKVLMLFHVNGNPDIAKITDDKIYIPLKYQGLLIIDRLFIRGIE